LTPLPSTQAEVMQLAALYGAQRSKVYVGAEAREERLKAEAGGAGVLHLATHAVLNDASPMYSQIVLAQPGEKSSEDGLLEAWEIMKLDLRTDLVVLSACETGRGRIGAGEGLIGLTWAFFVAGAPSTVVSQWKVDAESTAELMQEFHRRMRARQPSAPTKAEALREAELKLLRNPKYRHPFYWASFSIIGEAM
jgi:CHAT domain-containing protein